MDKSLLNFMEHVFKYFSLSEGYGEKVVDRVFWRAHDPNNVLGVFWYYAPSREMIYSKEYKDHTEFPEREELLKRQGMLIRGRVLSLDNKTIIMVYFSPSKGNEEAIVADILHKIVKATGFEISYIVDEMGVNILSETVIEAIKEVIE